MMNKCKDCGASMIPGVMSEGWCSAECDLRVERKEAQLSDGTMNCWRSLNSPSQLMCDCYLRQGDTDDTYVVTKERKGEMSYVGQPTPEKHCFLLVTGKIEKIKVIALDVLLPVGTVLKYIGKGK